MLVPPAGDAMKMGPPAPLQHTRRREEGKKESVRKRKKRTEFIRESVGR
jgi:hypothetical protein